MVFDRSGGVSHRKHFKHVQGRYFPDTIMFSPSAIPAVFPVPPPGRRGSDLTGQKWLEMQNCGTVDSPLVFFDLETTGLGSSPVFTQKNILASYQPYLSKERWKRTFGISSVLLTSFARWKLRHWFLSHWLFSRLHCWIISSPFPLAAIKLLIHQKYVFDVEWIADTALANKCNILSFERFDQ